jgi:simple sugar transport system ATP-binding protein
LRAVDGVSLAFEAGRIHAVVGENGAGKTTLLRIAAGLLAPDEPHGPRESPARVRLDGVALALGSRAATSALHRGVSMVEQHFALVNALSALENVMLGAEPVRAFGRLDRASARAKAERVAREAGAVVDWDAPVARLGVGERQRLEIVRALVRDARVLVLDEPTAALIPAESVALYATLRRLAGAGHAIVVVTHRLDEVQQHADDVSVMRHGRLVSTHSRVPRRVPRPVPRDAPGEDEAFPGIARDIMGDAPPAARARAARKPGEVALHLRDARRAPGLRGATLEVRAGEIVGVAGVDGNGQRELVRVLAGIDALDAGELRRAGVAVVHEDREADGLVLDASVRDNLMLGELRAFTRFGVVDRRRLEAEARDRLGRAGIVPPDLDAPVRALSGGNRQKVVMARAIARAPRVSTLVLAQPTRGVDAAGAQAIHGAIADAAAAGKAVLVVSADLDELRALCDRILVMSRGTITADLPPDAPEARFGDAMLGAQTQGAPA